MSDAIELHLERYGLLVERPIVDFLYRDAEFGAYMINFVPESSVSRSETEAAEVPKKSSDGQRIALQLDRLASLLGPAVTIEKIVHDGGGDFTIRFEGTVFSSLSADGPDPRVTHEMYRCLQDIAMTAQVAYILEQRTPQTAVA